MALPLKRTLGELRSDIQIRLGFGMAGAAGVVNAPIVDSMLRSAQNQLYEQFDWSETRGVETRLTGQNQQFYDYPVNCNVGRMTGLFINWGGQYHPLKEGIDTLMRSTPSASIPVRFERRDQIELWPIPQAQYEFRIEYVKTLNAFTANSDRCTIPDEIVYLHALANAKEHYRQPDAKTYMSQLESLMMRLKARHRGNAVYSRTSPERSPYDYRPDSSQQT